jgi:hypothetical protein
MEENINGERKKLSLSSGGKLTLKNSVSSSKSSNSITTNSRAGRGTVQVEVKRTKRLSTRLNINEKIIERNNLELEKTVNRCNDIRKDYHKDILRMINIASDNKEYTKL